MTVRPCKRSKSYTILSDATGHHFKAPIALRPNVFLSFPNVYCYDTNIFLPSKSSF